MCIWGVCVYKKKENDREKGRREKCMKFRGRESKSERWGYSEREIEIENNLSRVIMY